MNDIAIRVENLSKLYHLGTLRQRPDTLREALVSVFQRQNQSTTRQSDHSDDLWALRDISFNVKRGEVVGTHALASGASVIGRNGAGTLAPACSAGEPTLLNILSHITEPTRCRAVNHCGPLASAVNQPRRV